MDLILLFNVYIGLSHIENLCNSCLDFLRSKFSHQKLCSYHTCEYCLAENYFTDDVSKREFNGGIINSSFLPERAVKISPKPIRLFGVLHPALKDPVFCYTEIRNDAYIGPLESITVPNMVTSVHGVIVTSPLLF